MHITCLRGGTSISISKALQKVGLSFNNNGEEDGTTLAIDSTKSKNKCTQCGRTGHKTANVRDVIITPIDMISAQKRTNTLLDAIRGAHKISKKI